MLELQEIAKLHSVWSTYYPSALKGDRDIHTERWSKAFEGNTFEQVRTAIEKLSNEWKDTYEPPFSQLIKYVNAEADKTEETNKKKKRRIVTPEEELANLYDKYTQILNSNKNLSDENALIIAERLETLKPFYKLFNGEGWEMRYAKYFRIENRPFFQNYKELDNGLELYLSEHNVREDYECY